MKSKFGTTRKLLATVAIVASLLIIRLVLPPTAAENDNGRTNGNLLKNSLETASTNEPAEKRHLPAPDGSRAVPIEINVDDASHNIIEPGDRMDVIELLRDPPRPGYLTLASNVLISKTDYDRRHPLIHVILEHEFADIIEPKAMEGNLRLLYALPNEN